MSIRNGGILRAAIKHLAMISPKNRRQRSDSEPKVHELVATQSVQLVFTRGDKVVVFGVSTHGVQKHRKFLQKAVNALRVLALRTNRATDRPFFWMSQIGSYQKNPYPQKIVYKK
jgi:hypothetical protein